MLLDAEHLPLDKISLPSLAAIENLIGNTFLHQLKFPYCNLYTKLEYQNCFGSIKDRPALYILKKLCYENKLTADQVIVESTSGNFGIALAGICRAIGLKFVAVIDPNISLQKEQLLRLLSHDVIKVTERDETGGYLINRIKTVNEFVSINKNSFNPNQYENPDNYLSYYNTLGTEICKSFTKLDYAFISVSSGGTIIGLSRKLKEEFPSIKIVGVDVEGSVIFSNVAKKRHLSGLGASKRTPLLEKALIDDFVILSEREIVGACKELLTYHSLLVGPSAGAAYCAAKNLMSHENRNNANALFITPDSGSGYLDTIFNDTWISINIE
jgi:N-(2-amino-2-carboxyethyl)-L-glutamate synthase